MSRSSASKDGRTGIYGRGDEKAHLRREEVGEVERGSKGPIQACILLREQQGATEEC